MRGKDCSDGCRMQELLPEKEKMLLCEKLQRGRCRRRCAGHENSTVALLGGRRHVGADMGLGGGAGLREPMWPPRSDHLASAASVW